MRATCKDMFAHKNAAVNLVDEACTDDKHNISSARKSVRSFNERTAAQANLKCKKKHSDNERRINETPSDILRKKFKIYFFPFTSYPIINLFSCPK